MVGGGEGGYSKKEGDREQEKESREGRESEKREGKCEKSRKKKEISSDIYVESCLIELLYTVKGAESS